MLQGIFNRPSGDKQAIESLKAKNRQLLAELKRERNIRRALERTVNEMEEKRQRR